MAKRATESSNQRPSSSMRVRWVEVEVNGADTTIEEALRAVERMRRPAIDAPASRKRIASSEAPASEDTTGQTDQTLFDNANHSDTAGANGAPMSEAETDAPSAAEQARKKRGEGDRRDRNTGIKPEGNIDFVPENKQSFKEFFAQKAPVSDMDQILVLCYFLQHTLEIPRIGPGHVLSGLKHVNQPIPKDLKQTIRNMKEKKAWLGFTDIEDVKLTTEGENRVEHGLGQGNGDSGAQ